MEIELGKGIETRISDKYRDCQGILKENAHHLTAFDIIESPDWPKRIKTGKTYLFIGNAIRICLTPDTS